MSEKTHKKPTSFDVAKLAGVHRSAVSRTLSGTGRVAPETKQKVEDAARELGYRVNLLARGLQNQNSGLVGIVASRLDTPYRASQVKYLSRELIARGYTPLLIVAEGGETVAGLMARLLNYSVTGMIVTSDTPPSEVIDECARLSVPVVLINRDIAVTGADRIQLDIMQSGQLAFDMLTRCSGVQFTVLMPEMSTYTVNGRAKAFLANCREAGFESDALPTGGQSYDDGLAAADVFIAQNTRADSVFCTTDLLALGFLDGLRVRHGVSVPGDVQLIGYDDIEQAGWLGNSLSTIRQDTEAVALSAVEMMEHRIHAPYAAFETQMIGISPVYRATTRPVAS